MYDTLDSLIDKVRAKLKGSSFFYLCNDPERALGLEKIIPNYHLVHIDNSQYKDDFNSNHVKYLCWQDQLEAGAEIYRSSLRLIKSEEFKTYFSSNSSEKNYIQTFKISPAFEKEVEALGAISVNPKASLNRLFEDKLSQFTVLKELEISLPKGRIIELNELQFNELIDEFGANFVIQFNKGHTGSSTLFINTISELEDIKEQYPNRKVKVAQFIVGATYTLNAVVGKSGIYMGALSKQITGDMDLTAFKGATLGNDWTKRAEFIKGLDELIKEVRLIGEKMRSSGYLGLFGIDLIVDKNGNHYIIEINARQPASIPMFTKIQLIHGDIPLALIHLAEFCDIPYQIDEHKYNQRALAPFDYSQIFVRSLKEFILRYPVRSGVYRLQGDNAAIDRLTAEVKPDTIFLDEERDTALLFQKDGYSVDDIIQGGLLVLTPAINRKLNINDEIGRVQLKGSALLADDQIIPWIKDTLIALRNYQN